MTYSDNRKIRIRELKVFAHHGVLKSETLKGQNFYINAELSLESDAQDVLSDDLDQTVMKLNETAQTLDLLAQYDIAVYLTREGAIRFTSTGSGVTTQGA